MQAVSDILHAQSNTLPSDYALPKHSMGQRSQSEVSDSDICNICEMICELCGNFKSLLMISDGDVMCRSTGPEFENIEQGLGHLCNLVQSVTVDDFPKLVDQLTRKFQSEAMTVNLTEDMVDSVDQLFSSLCLDSWSQRQSAAGQQNDLDSMCRMMRYIMTADKLEPATLVSYFQHFCIL